MTTILSTILKLSDADLLAQLERAAVQERQATAQLTALLMEVDARKLYANQSCSSLFTYCVQVLHFSEHAAYLRIEAARTARRFPVILDQLADGSLPPAIEGSAARESTQAPQSVVAPAIPPQIKPLAPERFTIQFTVGRETYEKLRHVQDLLRHTIPNGDPAAIFDRALSLLFAELERTKFAAVRHPRPGRHAKPGSRHIPAAIKREVWRRDGGQCAFRGEQGRCGETGFLEFHHVVPFARGGATTCENLELRCRTHNAYEAEQEFPRWADSLFARETRAGYVSGP